jgi:hypothetical protein
VAWLCDCGLHNVNANLHCADSTCHKPRPEESEWDSLDELISKVWHSRIDRVFNLYLPDEKRIENPMTPEEQKFADFFAGHIKLVQDMDLLEVRAYREQQADTAASAKAGYYACDVRERELRKKKGDGPIGFETSVNVDETATNAINTIKERQSRMSKKEQVQAQLKKLYEMAAEHGIIKEAPSDSEVQKKLQAGTILGRVKRSATELDGAAPAEPKDTRPLLNPFAKPEQAAEPKPIINPFAKE